MGTADETILTVNAGSSSLKLVFYSAPSLERQLQASVTNIAQPSARLILKSSPDTAQEFDIEANDHHAALEIAIDHLADRISGRLVAIGHRVVHGGPAFDAPIILTAETREALRSLIIFDPGHMPAALSLIEACNQRFPGIPQVACFDTSFYHDMPKVAQTLPLPRQLETLGLRRYGFHGLSYESLLRGFSETAGSKAAHGRIILAHLGSGSSLTAVKDGHVLDTTMSFTPVSGIPMSTRSGDIDPGIVGFLHNRAGMTMEAFDHMVHFESGLLGVSGLTSDMERLLAQASTNPQAAEAVDLFCYHARKAIGSLAAVLGGLDSLVFAGGIGEQSAEIRTRICSGLDHLGIALDSARNEAHDFLISSDGSQAGVHVMQSDEAAVIASQTIQLVLDKAGHDG